MDPPYAPLSESCAKALDDKMYEKRKVASQKIEKMITEFNSNSLHQPQYVEKLGKIIRFLIKEQASGQA